MRTALAAMAMGMLARITTTCRRRGFFHEVSVKDGQGKEAHEGTDAAASLPHLEVHDGELKDVAFPQNRHAAEWKQGGSPAYHFAGLDALVGQYAHDHELAVRVAAQNAANARGFKDPPAPLVWSLMASTCAVRGNTSRTFPRCPRR